MVVNFITFTPLTLTLRTRRVVVNLRSFFIMMVSSLHQYTKEFGLITVSLHCGTSSELPLIGITNFWDYQFGYILVGIPNWLETLIRIARNYQHSELPIFGIFNRNTEREPGYGLRYGLGCILGYGLGMV